MSLYTSIPSINAYPLDLARAPISILINVDFPAPFYPSRATISPFLSYAVTPFSAKILLP